MYVGIDVGGTNLKAGVVTPDGRILSTAVTKAAEYSTDTALVDGLVRLARRAVGQAGLSPERIEWVGMGIPGAIDVAAGVVVASANAPFDRTPVRGLFQQRWNLPVFLENDANCAAVGEYTIGSTKDSRSSILVTLGTGVGGGYISDGRLQSLGMEVGHMVLQVGGERCPCGRRGCWERYSSASALKWMTREEMDRTPESMMWLLCDGRRDNVKGRTCFEAAQMKDPAALRVTDRYLTYLSEGLANLVNLFQPEVICLGGGVSNEKDENFLYPLRERVAALACPRADGKTTRLVRAVLGNAAGIIGAAMLGTQK